MEDIKALYYDHLVSIKNYAHDTAISYVHDVTQFEAFITKEGFAKDLFGATKERMAKNFIAALDTQGIGKKSLARKISALRNFYQYLVDDHQMETNIFMLIKPPKVPKQLPHIIDDDAVDYLFKSIDISTPLGYRNYVILDLLYSCGLRASELCGLKTQDIFLANEQLLIHGKGSKDRYVPIHQTLEKSLKHYLSFIRPVLLTKGDSLELKEVFINYKGTALTTRGLRVILKDIIEKSGETYKMHPHMLRHAFATTLLNHGAYLKEVKELLGHANLKSTQVYTHVSSETLKESYVKTHPRMIKK